MKKVWLWQMGFKLIALKQKEAAVPCGDIREETHFRKVGMWVGAGIGIRLRSPWIMSI